MSQQTQDDLKNSSAKTRRAHEGHPLLGSWEQRLQKARINRAKLIASASGNADKSPREGMAPEHAKLTEPPKSVKYITENGVKRVEAGEKGAWAMVTGLRRFLPSGRITVVISGAMGFGLGIGLAFGILIGIGTQPFLASNSGAQDDLVASVVTSSSNVGVSVPRTEIISEIKPEIEPENVQEARFINAPAAVVIEQMRPNRVISETAAPVSFGAVIEDAVAEIKSVQPASVNRPEPPDRLAEPKDWRATDAAYPGQPGFKPEFFMHAPDGVSTQRLQGVVAKLEVAGVEISQIGRESFRVSTTHLRYFSATTAPVAMAVAQDLGVEARDFSGGFVSNDRIEIWVAGAPKPVAKAEPEPSGLFRGLWAQRREDR